MSTWKEDFVIKNKFSRPGYKNLGVRGLVMHWTADPGATDENEHDFFDGSDGGGGRYAGAHLFVDRDSATQLIPFDEIAYHANEKACRISKLKGDIKFSDGSTYHGDANVTSIGIEMCVEKDGTIHGSTVKRAEQVAAELCKKYGLDPAKDIYRHNDITGKNCPAPWVSHPELFTQFKKDVDKLVNPPKAASKPEVSKPSAKPFRIKVKAKDLWYYDKADWNARHALVHKGEVFTAVDTLTVDGYKMYKLVSGTYITASTKYVEVLK